MSRLIEAVGLGMREGWSLKEGWEGHSSMYGGRWRRKVWDKGVWEGGACNMKGIVGRKERGIVGGRKFWDGRLREREEESVGMKGCGERRSENRGVERGGRMSGDRRTWGLLMVDKGMQVYGRKKRLHKEDTYLIAMD